MGFWSSLFGSGSKPVTKQNKHKLKISQPVPLASKRYIRPSDIKSLEDHPQDLEAPRKAALSTNIKHRVATSFDHFLDDAGTVLPSRPSLSTHRPKRTPSQRPDTTPKIHGKKVRHHEVHLQTGPSSRSVHVNQEPANAPLIQAPQPVHIHRVSPRILSPLDRTVAHFQQQVVISDTDKAQEPASELRQCRLCNKHYKARPSKQLCSRCYASAFGPTDILEATQYATSELHPGAELRIPFSSPTPSIDYYRGKHPHPSPYLPDPTSSDSSLGEHAALRAYAKDKTKRVPANRSKEEGTRRSKRTAQAASQADVHPAYRNGEDNVVLQGAYYSPPSPSVYPDEHPREASVPPLPALPPSVLHNQDRSLTRGYSTRTRCIRAKPPSLPPHEPVSPLVPIYPSADANRTTNILDLYLQPPALFTDNHRDTRLLNDQGNPYLPPRAPPPPPPPLPLSAQQGNGEEDARRAFDPLHPSFFERQANPWFGAQDADENAVDGRDRREREEWDVSPLSSPTLVAEEGQGAPSPLAAPLQARAAPQRPPPQQPPLGRQPLRHRDRARQSGCYRPPTPPPKDLPLREGHLASGSDLMRAGPPSRDEQAPCLRLPEVDAGGESWRPESWYTDLPGRR